MTEPVLFRTESTASGYSIGVATLNSPKSLNSLSLDMIDLLLPQLLRWQDDDSVVAVWLEGEGEKAFCAGGDIVRMYQSMVDTPAGERNRYIENFFSQEYQLDYLLHTYAKPVICWGHGIVMGGGLGLLSGCSHRVVTERCRIAMPEITIGLHPDVGGSWFLSRMPGRSGLFLGLTGAQVNAADALYVGLADRVIEGQAKGEVFAELQTLSLSKSLDDNTQQISALLRRHELALDKLPQSALRQHFDEINSLCDADTLAEVVANIVNYSGDDEWMSKAAKTLSRGCAQTAWLVWEGQKRVKHLSLAQAFRMEWNMSVTCAARGDFQEGVRALLIDKDGKPAFRFARVDDVPSDYINEFFKDAVQPHPLEDL
ncbi:MAG: enoyl-CoA hydratase/isomerase family protein [Alcanivoracaceae bacterium]|nr:enoyl-CoA hydratase/isomerase family protein [Alcanivoracaceae bacterium]